MRLLVYGGNLYEVRRRIGVWPKLITDEILQERYALSERKPAFGVGLLDDSPFLIFRKIQPHKDRSYPLTILLDPGTAAWELYEWNGAHLLQALFIEGDSPGQKLLHEAETFQSEQDLERLLQELGRMELPAVSPSEDEEKVWQWWFASLASEEPVIASPDGKVIGLNARPLVASMAQLMTRVPPLWRSGKGWLIGGHRGQVKSFGVHFVFDDGKVVEDRAEAREQTLQVLRQSEEQFTACEAARAQNSDDLADFFKHPLWQSEKQQSDHTTGELFSDLKFLKSLSSASLDLPEERLDVVLNSVVERLEKGIGPLRAPIGVAASKLAQAGTGLRTPGQTRFLLFDAYENKKGIAGDFAERLDPDAAIEFFVERKLYPTAAKDLMPAGFRIEVCQKLMEKELHPDKIPNILSREIEVLSQTASPQSLEKLVDSAVLLSIESASSLKALWQSSANNSQLSSLLEKPLKDAARYGAESALRNTEADSAEMTAAGVNLPWLEDYFLFGQDSGGGWLAEKDFDSESASRLVNLIAEAAASRRSPGYPKLAQTWLSDLALTDFRSLVPVKAKYRIIETFLGTKEQGGPGQRWVPFNALKRIIEGDATNPGPVLLKTVREHPDEQLHLLSELREFADLVLQARQEEGSSYPPPNTLSLSRLFSKEHLPEVAGVMLRLRPDLTKQGATAWLEGWLEFGKVEDEEAASRSWEKYQEEWIRFLLESNPDIPIADDAALSSKELLANFAQDRLAGMLDELLFGGGTNEDKNYSTRFAEFLNIGGKIPVIRQLLQDSFERSADGPRVEVLLRRHAKAVKKLEKILTAEQVEQLTEATRLYKEKEVQVYQKKVRDYFLEVHMRDFVPEFPLLKSSTERDIFVRAVGEAFLKINENPQDQSRFLRRFALDKKARKLVSENLPSDSLRETFDLLILEEQQRQLRKELENYLYDGEPEDDDVYRETLETRLKKKAKEEDEIKGIIKSVVGENINDPARQAVFKRRFMYMKQSQSYRYKTAELNVVSLIFSCLEWETQKAILIFLYEADKELFTDMTKNVFLYLEKNQVSFFHYALLQFIKTNHRIAVLLKHQLEAHQDGKLKVKEILGRVSDPQPDETSFEKQSSVGMEKGEKPPARKRGFFKKMFSFLGEEDE